MALRFSTGLRDAFGGLKALPENLVTGTTISFGDGTGTGGRDQILDSGNGLGSYEVKKMITVQGSTSNDGDYEILSVAAGAVEIPAASLVTEAAGDQVILASAIGGSLSDILRNGVMYIYSGTQPATADLTESGTLLAIITLASGAFTPGSPTNGINWDVIASGVLAKDVDETWSGLGLSAGTMGWFRFYANDRTQGASSTAVRLDGAINTSGAELNVGTRTVVVDVPITIDSFPATIPAS